MNCQRNFQACLAIAVVLLILPQPQTLAQQTPSPQVPIETNKISPANVTLRQLESSDILVREQDFATNSQQLLTPPQFQVVTRIFEWKMRVNLQQLKSPVDVTYELKDENGTSNQLIYKSDSTLAVKVNNSNVKVTPDADNKTAVLEGSVSLLFNGTNARSGGNDSLYKGQISVCVRDNNGGCL